jgi:uncharacterized protein YecE (DUF72 family)
LKSRSIPSIEKEFMPQTEKEQGIYSDDELLEFANIARDLARRGASEVYVFFNNDYSANACENPRSLLNLLGK